jgi:hypothetical protein
MTRKRLAAIAVGAGLAAGSLTGLALNFPGMASAQDAPTDAETAPPPGAHQGPMGILDDLVDDGTITQQQADAIRARAAERHAGADHRNDADGHPHRAGHGPGESKGHGPGGPQGGGGPMGRGAGLDAAATAIGISTDELRDALRNGQSIASVAEANGVAVDTVIDAMAAEARQRISDQVTRVPGARPGD